ncbi:uncharacterized protein [Procambarus clarkii]|uniref:uncharacterized protein n=1 Tax=Procambarus clarkii TaxID=6728 RepID=UPI0037421513
MKLLVPISVLVAAAYASPQGYTLQSPSGPGFSTGGSRFSSGSGLTSGGSGFSGGGCGSGQLRHVDGSCVTPQVTRNLYVYNVPQATPIVGPRPNIPPPRVEHNIVFIRTPENGPGQEPIVVPPPQRKNVVYVLNKRPVHDQKVIHVPTPEQQSPEVFFVNYGEGENPTLPSGEDLQSALRSAAQGGGNVIGGGGGGGAGFASGGVSIGGEAGFVSGGGSVSGEAGFVSGGGSISGEAGFVSGGGSISGEAGFVSGGGRIGGDGGFSAVTISSVPQPSGLYSKP